MFETFSTNALQIIDDALQIARSLNKKLVGSEHLLLAMYKKSDTICHFLLEEKGITYDDILKVLTNLIIFRKSEYLRDRSYKTFSEGNCLDFFECEPFENVARILSNECAKEPKYYNLPGKIDSSKLTEEEFNELRRLIKKSAVR